MNVLDAAAIARLAPSVFSAPGCGTLDDTVQHLFAEVYLRVGPMLESAYFLDRLGSAIFYRVPQLLGLGRDLSQMNALELGCGRGLKSFPWSSLFRRYWGIDHDADAIAFARRAARATSAGNLEFAAANVVEVMRDPRRFGIEERIDCIVLYAVLEHLTLPERREVLCAMRDLLANGGLLIVGETPNRLIPHDGHSTYLHFFQTLPPELALAYISQSPRADAQAVRNVADPQEALYRFGQAVSYPEFELFLAGADKALPAIVADGWGLWTVFDEPIRRDELALADYLRHHGPLAHPAFARYWIEAIFDFAATRYPAAFPFLLAPRAESCTQRDPRPQCWMLDTFACGYSGRLDFDLAGSRAHLLQIDLEHSAGSFGIFDSEDRPMQELEVERLRTARFPRWHSRCALDLSWLPPTDSLSLRPLDAGSQLVVDGLLAVSQ